MTTKHKTMTSDLIRLADITKDVDDPNVSGRMFINGAEKLSKEVFKFLPILTALEAEAKKPCTSLIERMSCYELSGSKESYCRPCWSRWVLKQAKLEVKDK
jgi:hypothetical protein